MRLLIDSFWRAAAYCLRPGVIVLSILPLVLTIAAAVSMGYFFWDNALDHVRSVLESDDFANHGWAWLDKMGLGRIKTVLAPMVVIFAVTPLIVIGSLLAVAFLMTPWLLRLVARRRFPLLKAQGTRPWMSHHAGAVLSAALALVAITITVPLWFVPPLVLVVPPLIWGWLTYRVMAMNALSEHASTEERRVILKQHRPVLLGMGVLVGFMGAAPSLLWASAAAIAPMFVIVLPLTLWTYTLVFAFSSLWFSHYCLAALQAVRAQAAIASPGVDIELPGAAP